MAISTNPPMFSEQFICSGNLGLSLNRWYSQTRLPPKQKSFIFSTKVKKEPPEPSVFSIKVKEEPLEFSVEKAALNVFYYQFLGGNTESSQISLRVFYKTVKIHRQEEILLESLPAEKSYKTQNIEDCFQEVRNVNCDFFLSVKVHERIREQVLPFIQQWLKKDPVKTEPLAYV